MGLVHISQQDTTDESEMSRQRKCHLGDNHNLMRFVRLGLIVAVP